jgi:hypothetical protein
VSDSSASAVTFNRVPFSANTRQSPPSEQGSTQGLEDSAGPSHLADYVESNRHKSVDASCEALQRYFSSERPMTISNHDSIGTSITARECHAQAAIDAFNALMEGHECSK